MRELKPYKNLMIISFLLGLVSVFYFNGQNERNKMLNLRSDNYILKQENKALKEALKERDSIIVSSYKWHNRVRIMLGSDSLGLVQYSDLLKLDYKGVSKLNKLDLR